MFSDDIDISERWALAPCIIYVEIFYMPGATAYRRASPEKNVPVSENCPTDSIFIHDSSLQGPSKKTLVEANEMLISPDVLSVVVLLAIAYRR